MEDMEMSHEEDEDVDCAAAKKREAPETDGGGRVAQQVNLLENTAVPTTMICPLKEQEKKRARKNAVIMTQTVPRIDWRSPWRRVTGHNENQGLELPRARQGPGSESASGHPEARKTRCVFPV